MIERIKRWWYKCRHKWGPWLVIGSPEDPKPFFWYKVCKKCGVQSDYEN